MKSLHLLTKAAFSGDPANPSTFFKSQNSEQSLAAYLGFTEAASLRSIAAAWPLLRACIAFDKIGDGMSYYRTYTLTNDSKDEYTGNRRPDCSLAAEDETAEVKSEDSRGQQVPHHHAYSQQSAFGKSKTLCIASVSSKSRLHACLEIISSNPILWT
jgi:hypothetical protein